MVESTDAKKVETTETASKKRKKGQDVPDAPKIAKPRMPLPVFYVIFLLLPTNPQSLLLFITSHCNFSPRGLFPNDPFLADTDFRSRHADSEVMRGSCVWACGEGAMLQLGILGITDTPTPRPCKGLNNIHVLEVSAGGASNVLITEDEQGRKHVYTFGSNDAGALGRPTEKGDDDAQILPTMVPSLEGLDIVQVSNGDCHMAALSSSGQMYTWGCYRDSTGIVGFADGNPLQPTPLPVKELTDVIDIASGDNSTLAVTKRGDIYIWGDVRHGQRLSQRVTSRMTQLRPMRVNTSVQKFDTIIAGGFHYFARSKGTWYCWGLNNWGQLGLGKTKGLVPPVDDGSEESRREVEAFCNKYYPYQPAPVKFPVPEGITDIKMIAAGQHHSALLTTDGHVYTWGRGEYGQLGNGTQAVPRVTCRNEFPSTRK
jgi:regulator of chromosome condensation